MVIVLLFGALNTPYTLKHLRNIEEAPEAA
jgi:hypothetical protein